MQDACEIPDPEFRAAAADQTVERILGYARRIAVVGASDNPARPSYDITDYLIRAGFEVFPVNPGKERILDRPCYASLAQVPGPIDVVNVFRRPDAVPEIAEEAIRAGARALWLQLGVVHNQAARRAREAGLDVVMDRCIKVEHRLTLPPAADRR